MMTQKYLRDAYEDSGAVWRYRENPSVCAILTDDTLSDFYFNARIVGSYPRLLSAAAMELLRLGKISEERQGLWFIGPERGAITLAHELARLIGGRCGFTEKTPGGGMDLAGFPLRRGDRVIAVDDAMHGGKSTERTIKAIERAGGVVLEPILTLVQRRRIEKVCGRKVITTVAFEEGTSWPSEKCPLPAESKRLRPKDNWHLFVPPKTAR